jgi:hypothetical protein
MVYDSDWKVERDPGVIGGAAAAEILGHLAEEVGVLEEHQDAEVRAQAQDDQCLRQREDRSSARSTARVVIGDDRAEQQRERTR